MGASLRSRNNFFFFFIATLAAAVGDTGGINGSYNAILPALVPHMNPDVSLCLADSLIWAPVLWNVYVLYIS